MYTVGEYKWQQLSMWGFAPKDSIEKFRRSSCGKHVFHYYLEQCIKVTDESRSQWRTCKQGDIIPQEVMDS
jgi:hypothetical protein